MAVPEQERAASEAVLEERALARQTRLARYGARVSEIGALEAALNERFDRVARAAPSHCDTG